MTTLNENIAQARISDVKVETVIEKLYDLRKAFEADYSGALRTRKYEATRAFTISLNHTIFQANQLQGQDSDIENVTRSLQEKLASLEKDFDDLLG